MYPQIFGKYVLERELARGGMARVLLATLRGAGGFEKKLVVKQIRDELATDGEFVKRFVEEAKTTVALSHPNIVPVYELGVEHGTYFLAMELVEGVSIYELLAGGQLSPEQGAYVGVEVCRALDYAHRRMGVVHRDITPRNVMVDEEGQIKLIDFGIASLSRVGDGRAEHQVFGSPGHMPPEQMAGDKVGPPADLFALGALLLEAWCGKAPFRRKTPEAIDEALRGPHPKASDADIRLLPLDAILATCTDLNPELRPQQAEDLGRALRKFLMGIDLGDVARELGERVRACRTRDDEKRTAALLPQSEPRPRMASQGDLVTKTFAAREEVKKWSERPPPSEDGQPSTRKMAGDDVVETIATRPIETPAKVATREPTRRDPPRWGLYLGLGMAAAVGYFVWRGPGVVPSTGTATATVTSTATATPTSTATSTATITPSAGTGTGTGTGTGSAMVVVAKAHVVLMGDPGTRVSVDGQSLGTCPIKDFALDPGDHEVRFSFDPTGETSGKKVHFGPGEKITVRADFAGATPTVSVQR